MKRLNRKDKKLKNSFARLIQQAEKQMQRAKWEREENISTTTEDKDSGIINSYKEQLKHKKQRRRKSRKQRK